jgi:two-component system C4-dicarboxylate transport sensor histidine kinase DctB
MVPDSAIRRKRDCSSLFHDQARGLGLGLGLPLSAEIAQAAGGSLTGGNHPEGGAIFTLSLPLVDTRPLS